MLLLYILFGLLYDEFIIIGAQRKYLHFFDSFQYLILADSLYSLVFCSFFQFDDLWKKFPLNRYNQLEYDKFLEQYSCPLVETDNAEIEVKNSTENDKNKCKCSVQFAEDKTIKSTENRKTAKVIYSTYYQALLQNKKMQNELFRFSNIASLCVLLFLTFFTQTNSFLVIVSYFQILMRILIRNVY